MMTFLTMYLTGSIFAWIAGSIVFFMARGKTFGQNILAGTMDYLGMSCAMIFLWPITIGYIIFMKVTGKKII